MTTLSDFIKVDGVDYPLAEYFNFLYSASLRAELTNIETISATKELTDNDVLYQVITASGADRDIELAPEATTNHPAFIYNAGGSRNLFIKDDSGTTTFAVLVPGKWAFCMPISGTTWVVMDISSSDLAKPNLLINGSFDFAQRQTPGTLTNISNDKYGADRWRISRENGELQYQRNDALGESGLTSRYYGTFKKITSAGKFAAYQPIEGANSVPRRGRTMIFPIKMKASSSKTIRMAVLELQNAGTIDSIPSTLVSAWGANGTDPTFGSNLAVIGSVSSKSVTTSWQTFYVIVTVPSNSKNLICAVWSDSQFSANDTLSIAEADFYPGNSLQNWSPRPWTTELLLCQRHYWKTFEVDVAPAENAGTQYSHRVGAITAGATTQRFPPIFFPVPMFKAQTFVLYNPSQNNAQARDVVAAADCSATSVAASSLTLADINCTGAAGTAVGNSILVSMSAEAEL